MRGLFSGVGHRSVPGNRHHCSSILRSSASVAMASFSPPNGVPL